MFVITIIGLASFCVGGWLATRATTHAIGTAAVLLVAAGGVTMILSVIILLLRLYVDSL